MYEESALQDFKDATVVHINKRKGDRSNCDNHGISLLSGAEKFYPGFLLTGYLSTCLATTYMYYRIVSADFDQDVVQLIWSLLLGNCIRSAGNITRNQL